MEDESPDGREPLNGHPLLEDIYGNKKFKQELSDIVLSLQNQMVYHYMGANPPRSFLFEGAPGTGKTYAVKAIANELTKEVAPKQVAFMSYDIGKYGTAYINMGSRNIQGFFDMGKKLLYNPQFNIHGVVYWFDEVDALLGQRGSMHSHKEDDKVAETIMKNLQEINDRRDNEYVFLATNFKEALDKASIRSGRIDKILHFELPDAEARSALLNGYINKVNDFARYKVIRNYNVDELVEKTKGMNCSDLEAIVDKALNNKITIELRKKDKGVLRAYWINQQWLKQATAEVREMHYKNAPLIGFK